MLIEEIGAKTFTITLQELFDSFEKAYASYQENGCCTGDKYTDPYYWWIAIHNATYEMYGRFQLNDKEVEEIDSRFRERALNCNNSTRASINSNL